jgi:predicted RNase H-like HicB family nuclease
MTIFNVPMAKTAPSSQSLTAILHWEKDVYVAECPEIGTASQGESIEEALVNLKEATELYLEEFPMPSAARRLVTSFRKSLMDGMGPIEG